MSFRYLTVFMILAMNVISIAQTGVVETFSNAQLPGWGGTADYQLSAAAGILKVQADKRDTWNSFTFSFSALDISAHPFVSVTVKTDQVVNLGFSVWDAGNQYEYTPDIYQEVIESPHFIEYCFDFSSAADKVNLKKIRMLNFVFNPGGAKGYSGIVYFDEIRIGDQARVFPRMTTIPTQTHYINAAAVTVPFRGVEPISDAAQPLTITAQSSNRGLVPDPIVNYVNGQKTGSLSYTPVADMSGEAVVTVTTTGADPDAKVVKFTVQIEKNKAPRVEPPSDLVLQAGQPFTLQLSGIDDGNGFANQRIELTAVSADTAIVGDPTITYKQGETNAWLLLQPKRRGATSITISLLDDGGTAAGGVNALQVNLNVTVYDGVNEPPTLDPIADSSILEGAETHLIPLTGISDGDVDAEQALILTAKSSNSALIPDPLIEYTQGDSTALLRYTPNAGKTGSTTITVAVADDGGTDDNNGDQSKSRSFFVQVRVKPIYGFEDEFDDGVLAPQWPPDWGVGSGENSHRCSEAGGAMRIEIDKTRSGNRWAGLWYSIPQEIDLSVYPYISIRMKTDVPGTRMLIFLWDAYDHYNTGGTVEHVVTKDYVEYFFDYTGKNLQGDGTIVDFSRIKALLINFDPGGDSPLFKGSFYFDDFRTGEFAHRPVVMPNVVFDPIPDVPLPENCGEQQIEITGVSAGADNPNPVILTAKSSKTALIPEVSASSVVNGRATLTFTPVADQVGTTVITVTAAAEGANPKSQTFKIQVIKLSESDAVDVDVNLAKEYQTIDGFGAFMGSGGGKTPTILNLAKDIGMSMARFGIIDREFEPLNDNSDAQVIDLSRFDHSAISLETMRWLKSYGQVDKFILTMWSPPAWMKRNKAIAAEYWATDNKLEPHYYEEYAEHLTAVVKTIKNETGIDLYAISLQNEPEFNEPYASCVILWNEMRDLIKVVGPRFEREGLSTKIFWAEALPAQGHIRDYIMAVKNDPEAAKYADIVAIHNYDADGINVGGAGAQQWKQIYQWAQTPAPACPTWMTETSGHANSWDGAMELAGNIYNALGYGNASAWVWWSFNDPKSSENYGLVVDNEPTSRYYVSKQYYKFIRPGAIRVEHQSEDDDIPALAFKNPLDAQISIILINKSTTPRIVRVNGQELPAHYQIFTTAKNRHFVAGEPVSNGQLFLLPANSISTLIGDYDPAGVDDDLPQLPEQFQLYQNYPNPFNPSTTIEFELPETSDVTLKIYNILGREVITLLDRTLQPGRHSFLWNGVDRNGAQVAAGMYLYRLQANDFTAVRKAVYIK